ncbi:hypothetical protein [Nesterenkonia sp. K-15-9-6]|uniref:hypothetical protein n=1 Tax=Nesterenkonia sp. K-15-9-6 TaxID=3093918 RepID=UPI0040440735
MNGLPGNGYAMRPGQQLPDHQAAHSARMAGVFEQRTANMLEALAKIPMGPEQRRRTGEDILRRLGWNDLEIALRFSSENEDPDA